jgi:[acyl-carrier-protein] S-malonyltransferase
MHMENETTTIKRLAFVYPGQGSQSVGMLAELAQTYPVVKETFAEASAVLDYDLWQLVQQGPEADLNRTDRTQPAMLAAGVAVWRVWISNGGAVPEILAGHSLGEYTALVCSEALAFADAIRLVADRGRFMQEAVPSGQGAMAAILGLEDAQVIAVCRQAEQGDVVTAVNFNAPGQVVIAGTSAAVERAVALAREAGAKRAITLPVSVPSHCALMKPAAENMRHVLAKTPMHKPVLPVLHNADVASYADIAKIRDALVRQLYSPVRWVETVQNVEKRGVNIVIECGPGKVLAGLNKRIGRELVTLSVYDPDSLEEALSVV